MMAAGPLDVSQYAETAEESGILEAQASVRAEIGSFSAAGQPSSV